jgi:hypothetical protein|tara:strand:- start:557 stop:1546 length:990 start_codon:yes stop_codon:yes gene_type:complete
MNITIARIRSFVRYNGPLETVLDSFFENYVRWMGSNPHHCFDTYNVSFDNTMPKRTPHTIESADAIVIPSDNEFRYHGKLQMHPNDLAKSNAHIDAIRLYFKNKRVVVFRSDRGDTEELYRNEVLQGVKLKSFTVIDEIDFSGNIHGMKYHFLQRLRNPLIDAIGEKSVDFGYWGRMKAGNDRDKTIRQIYRSELTSHLIGGMPSGVKKRSKWIKKWENLYPLLDVCRCTLCFNWLDPTATTARYVEALAVGMIPFVWRDYDINNSYRIDPWQRVYTFEEFLEKSLMLRCDDFRQSKLATARENYLEVLLTEDKYYAEFEGMMNVAIAE